jgi:hypothetical protein
MRKSRFTDEQIVANAITIQESRRQIGKQLLPRRWRRSSQRLRFSGLVAAARGRPHGGTDTGRRHGIYPGVNGSAKVAGCGI